MLVKITQPHSFHVVGPTGPREVALAVGDVIDLPETHGTTFLLQGIAVRHEPKAPKAEKPAKDAEAPAAEPEAPKPAAKRSK